MSIETPEVDENTVIVCELCTVNLQRGDFFYRTKPADGFMGGFNICDDCRYLVRDAELWTA